MDLLHKKRSPDYIQVNRAEFVLFCILVCFTTRVHNVIFVVLLINLNLNFRFHLLGQQVHEVPGSAGVGSEGRTHDEGGSVGPLIVPVVGTISAQSSGNGLSEHHATWREKETRRTN